MKYLTLVILAVAAVYDIRYRLVPKSIIRTGELIGFTMMLCNGEGSLLLQKCLWLIPIIVIGFFLVRYKKLGASDVRLVNLLVITEGIDHVCEIMAVSTLLLIAAVPVFGGKMTNKDMSGIPFAVFLLLGYSFYLIREFVCI